MHLHVNWEEPFALTDEEIERHSERMPEGTTGVYLIWSVGRYEGYPMVYVGSGDIITRLKDHVDERSRVMQSGFPNLVASYAIITDEEDYKGAENYLAYIYKPEVGDNYPNVTPREVNLLPDANPFEERNIFSKIEGIPYYHSENENDLLCWVKYSSAFCEWAKEQHREDYEGPRRHR